MFERLRIKRDGNPATLVVDGVEVTAPEGAMLVDAAKLGDVEIPVFCYEPKLGDPVGACRMCLVEIEGIPKLQTACSTPIRDGMVVYTRTDRVKVAQEAVVEFLLVNHPLDCPVCDKGGECPLQDIAMGWGPGKSRFTDPKRHFQKPLPLSPLVKIDRERCILCYRCVRFSQEVSEDEQLQLLERGDRTFVGTFDNRPYIAPFHGNIVELCPVGALTSQTYRFRARPWDIEDAGSICTLCPSQCNVLFTVRDERVERVLSRDNPDVDDGWLCDKGRFGYQMISSPDRITEPLVRQAGELRGSELGPRRSRPPPRGWAPRADAPPRSSAARPRTRRATSCRGSFGKRSTRRMSTRATAAGRPRAVARARPTAACGGDARSRPRGRDPRRGRGPAQLDADTRPADSQGGATSGRAARRRLATPLGARRRRDRGRPLRARRRRRPPRRSRRGTRCGKRVPAPGEYAEDAKRLASALRDTENVVVVWGEEPRRRGRRPG